MAEINRQRLQQFLTNVNQEILNMRSGESKFRTGAWHPEKDTCPALNRLKLFEDNPTAKNLTEFLALAKQDWGSRASDAFKLWSDAIFKPEAFEPVKPPVKEFSVLVKDHIYDFFKVVSTPMTPKQVELLEKHATLFAKTIKEEVSKEMVIQIKALVDQMKKDEGND